MPQRLKEEEGPSCSEEAFAPSFELDATRARTTWGRFLKGVSIRIQHHTLLTLGPPCEQTRGKARSAGPAEDQRAGNTRDPRPRDGAERENGGAGDCTPGKGQRASWGPGTSSCTEATPGVRPCWAHAPPESTSSGPGGFPAPPDRCMAGGGGGAAGQDTAPRGTARPGEHAPFPDGPHLLSPPPRADAPSARKHSRAASLDLPHPRRVSSPVSLPSLHSHLEARPLQDRLSACKLDPLTWAAKSVQRVRLTVKRPHAEQKHTPVGLSRRHAPYTRTHAPHAHRVSWRTP